MNKQMDLKNIERKIYMQFFEDGILDMAIGFGLMTAGLFVEFDAFYLYGAFLGLILLFPAFKKKITAPRVGRVNFSKKRKDRTTALFSVSVVGGLMLLALTILTNSARETGLGLWLGENLLFVIAASMLLMLTVVGWVLSFYRLIAYGVLVSAAVAASQWVGSFGWNLFFAGAVIFVVGGICLLRFLQRYPLQPAHAASEDDDAA